MAIAMHVKFTQRREMRKIWKYEQGMIFESSFRNCTSCLHHLSSQSDVCSLGTPGQDGYPEGLEELV
jgi:hypothetical protein